MKHKIKLTESQLHQVIKESIHKILLKESYLSNIYLSDNFKKWFSGSKMVDKNGEPLLLGHSTRNFGFKKFNTPFIHLSTIKDASYFSGGNKRLFRFKNTLDKLDNDDIINLYNQHFAYDEHSIVHQMTDDMYNTIIQTYEKELNAPYEEYKNFYDKKSYDKMITDLNTSYNTFLKYYQKHGNNILYRIHYKTPRLSPCWDDINPQIIKRWLAESFPLIKDVKQTLLTQMFQKDNYVGKGGTYPLCAKVLNPLHVNCGGNPWDNIYLTPNNCEAYDDIFKLYTENGYNTSNLHKGSWIALDNESIAFLARKLGYDGVIFHNIKEGAYGNIGIDTTYIVFSTKQLKSPFENNGAFEDVDNIYK